MLRIFFIISCIIAQNFFFAEILFAEQKAPQTMEEINADLLAKKAAIEPFDQKKVKIDVESLGLDDVDKKETATVTSKEGGSSPENNPIVSQSEPAATESSGMMSKIQNFLHKSHKEKPEDPQKNDAKPAEEGKPETPPLTSVSDTKQPTEKYINSTKKQSLKKRLEAENQRKLNQKKQQDKLKKLNELRQQYLIKSEELSSQNIENSDEDLEGPEEKIIPQRKEVSPFISNELPAPPILNRFRAADNLHIPIIITPQEKIDILFNAISLGSVSFFNDAYKNVANPNVTNQIGDTILTYALLLKKYPIIASVLAKGADPDMPNRLGYLPTSIAIEMLDIRSLEILTNNKADLEYVDIFGRTYLMHAARVGFLPAVELLVSKGADINAMDYDGFTALSIAYRHKKEIIVKFLLKNGAKTWIEKPYDPGEQSLIKELKNRWK